MKIRDTLLGLVVLGLVLAGFVWVRLPPVSPPRSTTDGTVSTDAPRGPGPSDPADAGAGTPDITRADGTVDLGELRVTMSVTPRPPVAFARKRFRVRVSSAAAQAVDTPSHTPMLLEHGRISFEMTMPMGDHRYSLMPAGDGWQEAEVVLPVCQSGNPRWYAVVEGTVAGRPLKARFRLDLTGPGSAPSP